jgi:hypothetical protein
MRSDSAWSLNYPYGTIEIEGQEPFTGRWLAQHFDRAAGKRYSIGKTPQGAFFVISLDECDRSVEFEWFRDAQAVLESALPTEMKGGTTLGDAGPRRTLKKPSIPPTSEGQRPGWDRRLEILKEATWPRVAPPSAPCPCGHRQFWLAPSVDAFRCARCNPP